MSSSCSILTPINLYHYSLRFLTTIQSSWNTQPHARQSIEAQCTSWGQGCSPTFVVKSLPFQGNSAPFRVTLLPLRTSLTPYLQYATQNQEKANCYATTSTKRQSNGLTNQPTTASHLPGALAIQIYVVTKELTNWPKQQPNNLEHQTLPQPTCSDEPENASQKHGLKLGRTILNRNAMLKQTGFPPHLDQHPISKTLETNGNYSDA